MLTAARLQRYALFLTGYDYTIEYKNTKFHSNADGLSRLPLVKEARDEEVVEKHREILFWLRCVRCPV